MVTRITQTYRKQWRTPKEVEAIIKKHIRHPCLNVCCGMQQLGDLRADVDPVVKPDVVCDAFNLSFGHGSFASVICDPPWAMPYPERIWLTKDISNVIEPGGYLIFNSPWVPSCKGLKISDLYILSHHYCHQNVSLLTILRKVNRLLSIDG